MEQRRPTPQGLWGLRLMCKKGSLVPLLQDYDDVVDHIQTEISLSAAEYEEGRFSDKKYIGLWDTGSTRTCIRRDLVAKLGLIPVGKSVIATANGSANVYTYIIGIQLPNGDVIQDLVASSSNLSGDVDVLIGMDVIKRGDFHIDNSSGKTNFSFRL